MLQQRAARASADGEDGDYDTLRSAKRRKTVDDRSLSQPPKSADGQATPIAPQSAETPREAGQSFVDGPDDLDRSGESNSQARKPTKRRKRKSIGQQSLFKKKRSSTGVTQTTESAPARRSGVHSEANHGDELEETTPDESTNRDHIEDLEEVGEPPESPSLEQEEVQSTTVAAKGPKLPKKRRKKRRSIGQQATRRKQHNSAKVDEYEHSSADEDEITPSIEDSTLLEDPVENEEDRLLSRNHSSRSAPPIRPSRVGSPDRGDSSGDEDYEDEVVTPEPEPEVVRGKKTKARASSQSRSDPSSDGRQRPARVKASFPIVTQRLAGFDTLPTIDEHGESELGSDEEQAREAELHALLDRPHPNAVDVLGQYCRETVLAAVDRLNEGPASNRGERKRKQAALEAVGRELDTQLVDMSAAVENRIQLSRRTRKAKKNRAELQSIWLETRKQREEIALKCDEIRQQNWQREQEREQKWAISEAAHKLTLEFERADPEEEQRDNLEFLLRTLADDVSDTSGAGLLDRIKSFNGQLERMAGVLEGRGVVRPQ